MQCLRLDPEGRGFCSGSPAGNRPATFDTPEGSRIFARSEPATASHAAAGGLVVDSRCRCRARSLARHATTDGTTPSHVQRKGSRLGRRRIVPQWDDGRARGIPSREEPRSDGKSVALQSQSTGGDEQINRGRSEHSMRSDLINILAHYCISCLIPMKTSKVVEVAAGRMQTM